MDDRGKFLVCAERLDGLAIQEEELVTTVQVQDGDRES
jgi:hypothetical protein